ncbi:MAG: DUF268 domain-containing protein [Bacteroidota bacterium]
MPKTVRAIVELPIYIKNYISLKGQSGRWKIVLNKPCLHDRSDASGSASGHYFFQDLYYAKKINQACPKKHVDVGSRVDGFVAHVASFRNIEVLDIRPNNSIVEGIVFRQCDLTEVPDVFVNYTDSLSCLHALEHFGLGRYGDTLDVNGHIKGVESLKQILMPGGVLYISVPIGEERIEFDAHRVFDPRTIIELFSDFELKDFAWVGDDDLLYVEESVDNYDFSELQKLEYGLGMFTFKKK